MSRHDPQIALPFIGQEGQDRISAARILIVGAGGLGSTAAELLCRAGVKDITLCDYDIIEESNLQRQSLYTTDDVGRLKVDAARERLNAIDPLCDIATIPEPFSPSIELYGFDVVLDGTDSLDARMLLNDAAKQARVPLIVAAAIDTRGMVFTVTDGACWQCIAKGKTASDDCSSGVLGTTTHLVASLQATAALRTILGEPPHELTIVDAWGMAAEQVIVKRNPSCAACAGRYEHLDAPFTLRFCASRQRLQARPNKPFILDLDALKAIAPVEQEYRSALLVRIGLGRALVHRFGAIEFTDVEEDEARRFTQMVLGIMAK